MIQSQDIAFLNAGRWEQLIMESLPELQKFHLSHSLFINFKRSISLCIKDNIIIIQ